MSNVAVEKSTKTTRVLVVSSITRRHKSYTGMIKCNAQILFLYRTDFWRTVVCLKITQIYNFWASFLKISLIFLPFRVFFETLYLFAIFVDTLSLFFPGREKGFPDFQLSKYQVVSRGFLNASATKIFWFLVPLYRYCTPCATSVLCTVQYLPT